MRKYDGHVLDARNQWANLMSTSKRPFINDVILKFIYSEKATKFCEISTLFLSYAVPVKRKVDISQNIVAFSECMNFKYIIAHTVILPD